MAELKQCDRCKNIIEKPAEIGVVIDLYRFITARGYIRPSAKLVRAIKEVEPEKEYIDMEFRPESFRQFDLCGDCYEEFMKFVPTA